MGRGWDVSDPDWELIGPVLRPQRREDGRGRPWQDTRGVLNGVLWVLGSGSRWSEMPERYPLYQTCHRRFQRWVREGRLQKVLRRLAKRMCERGDLELGRELHRRHVQQRKKGGFAVGPTRRGKGSKIMLIAEGGGLPIAANVDSAPPAECQLVEAALAGTFLDELPERMIGDKAYDSAPSTPNFATNTTSK